MGRNINPGTTFDCHQKNMESWASPKKNNGNGYNVPSLLLKLQKEVFDMQGAWYSPTTQPIMIYVQSSIIRVIRWCHQWSKTAYPSRTPVFTPISVEFVLLYPQSSVWCFVDDCCSFCLFILLVILLHSIFFDLRHLITPFGTLKFYLSTYE